MKVVNVLKKEYDDASGITWYTNPYYVHNNNSSSTSIYIGKKSSGAPWLKIKMSYYGDNWIYFGKAYLSFDGNKKEIPFDIFRDKKSENRSSGVSEWIDIDVDCELEIFLKKMVNGKSVKMVLLGIGIPSLEKTLSPIEILAIKDVLHGYDVLLTEVSQVN